MSEQSNRINPWPATLGLGVIGAAGGYTFAGKRPTLEKLVAQKPDTFVKTFSEDVMKNASEEQKTAVNTLKAAAEEVDKAGKPEFIAASEKEIKSVADAKANRVIDENLLKDVEAKKSAYTSKFSTERSALAKAKEDLKVKPEDADLKKAVKEAQTKFDEAVKGASKELDELKAARKKVFEAKAEVNKKFITEDIKTTVKTARENMKKAVEERTKAISEKLGKVVGEDANKKAFDSIKKLLPKEGKGKMAAIYGVAGLVVGYLATKLFGGKKEA